VKESVAGMVRVFAAQGVTVVATARREDRLLALADEIAKSGGVRPYVIAADITDAGALDSLLAQVQQRFGTIDIVINARRRGSSQPH
jgi:3-oxoacyl-[acyl-carrier protein] reductase